MSRYSGVSLGHWTRASLDLRAFAGKTVESALHFWSDGWGVEYGGWHVDDLMIQIGSLGLADVPDQVLDEKTPLSFKVNAVGANAHSSLAFTLPWAPDGAWIDPETGVFSWLPGERHGPGNHSIPVYVVDYGNGEANEMTTVKVTVNEVNERPWLLPTVLAVEPGQTLHYPFFTGDRDLPKNALEFTKSGAPPGATLTTNTGMLHWEVPTNAPFATYQINTALSNNGSPTFTTNNTMTLTVTPDARFGLSVRHLGGSDLEFTINDTIAGGQYRLQRAIEWVDPATWLFNSGSIPAWVNVLQPEDSMDWSTWDEFISQKLTCTQWVDVAKISSAQMPHTFVHHAAEMTTQPPGLYRLIRVDADPRIHSLWTSLMPERRQPASRRERHKKPSSALADSCRRRLPPHRGADTDQQSSSSRRILLELPSVARTARLGSRRRSW